MKRFILGLLLGVGLVAAGVALYAHLFRATETEPEWTVASYSGAVAVSVGGQAWEPATIKLRLRNSDRIRAGDDGEATLILGQSHVIVRPRTELQVSNLNAEASKFQVTEGVVQVEARGDRISLMTVSGARVDATDAGLGLSVRPEGDVVLMVGRGEAEISSMGGSERVGAGQTSTARAGRPPTKPVPIPAALLLNVQFPDAETFTSRVVRVEGTTSPGSRVLVAGRHVDVDATGRWGADLELEEGVNQIDVEARDALGRSTVEHSAPLRVDTTAPLLSGATIGGRSAQGKVTGNVP